MNPSVINNFVGSFADTNRRDFSVFDKPYRIYQFIFWMEWPKIGSLAYGNVGCLLIKKNRPSPWRHFHRYPTPVPRRIKAGVMNCAWLHHAQADGQLIARWQRCLSSWPSSGFGIKILGKDLSRLLDCFLFNLKKCTQMCTPKYYSQNLNNKWKLNQNPVMGQHKY